MTTQQAFPKFTLRLEEDTLIARHMATGEEFSCVINERTCDDGGAFFTPKVVRTILASIFEIHVGHKPQIGNRDGYHFVAPEQCPQFYIEHEEGAKTCTITLVVFTHTRMGIPTQIFNIEFLKMVLENRRAGAAGATDAAMEREVVAEIRAQFAELGLCIGKLARLYPAREASK